MAAHRATRPAPDPLSTAKAEIEARLSSGDRAVWDWLHGLTGQRQDAREEAPQNGEEFDYSRIADPVVSDWAETAAGSIAFKLGRAAVEVMQAGALLMEARQRLSADELQQWQQQACRLPAADARALAIASEYGDPADPSLLFRLSAAPSAPVTRDGGPVIDVAGDAVTVTAPPVGTLPAAAPIPCSSATPTCTPSPYASAL